MKISARNQIPGTVKMIKKGPVSTEVVISVGGGYEMVSSITTHSAESLKLKEGSKVYAIVKASEVMIGIDLSSFFHKPRDLVITGSIAGHRDIPRDMLRCPG